MKRTTRALPVGLAVLVLSGLLLLVGNAGAQTLTNLYSFGSSPTDGAYPLAGLVQGSDGDFYGTTSRGGTNNDGTVFQISPSGTETTLYSFVGSPTDGANPDNSGLVQSSDGNFYGTTLDGGTADSGTVFRISSSGSETTLYSFVGSPTDGANPYAGLAQGSDGNFYGTAEFGGRLGGGSVFRINPSGSETNLYSFPDAPNDGIRPQAGLVRGSDGNFYGTTLDGGTANSGTVFRISSSGSETNLHSFVGSPIDGFHPTGALVQGSDGNFYGTTFEGGTSSNGAVFRISPGGTYTTLYSFVGSPTDGANPYAGLVQGSDGNFYGTTGYGGAYGAGAVFRISPSGSCTTLYSFGGFSFGPPPDGARPEAVLVQGSDGNFYGTTSTGGAYNSGTVFRISVPLNPPPYPINQITGVRSSGTNIVFSIVSIANETYQLQFSSSLNPTNWISVPGVSVTNSIGALLTLTNFGGAIGPQGFYRFAITP